jgi:hypothetical protein
MATNESLPRNVQQAGSDVGKTVDLIVKTTVILAAVIYGCGFLVISIHQFRYGLVELNPLRPRVLAAGIWFLCFATIPFLLVIEYEKAVKSSPPERQRWLRKPSTTLFFDSVSCFWLGMIFLPAFDTGTDVTVTWAIASIGLMMVIVASAVFVDNRFPRWLVLSVSLVT